jgi:DNA-binding transcriptional LysR family regulator
MSRGVEIQFGALRTFAVVAESKTLTDAATRLGITQSAVSQAVAQFEEITATSLLVRRSRPIKLTPSGQTLNVHAKKILADTRQMLAAVQQDSNAGLSNLNIGFIDSFGDAVGPQIVDNWISLQQEYRCTPDSTPRYRKPSFNATLIC